MKKKYLLFLGKGSPAKQVYVLCIKTLGFFSHRDHTKKLCFPFSDKSIPHTLLCGITTCNSQNII